VAFAAGFASIRQFNDVVRAEFGVTPSTLRKAPELPDRPADPGRIVLRLVAQQPWDGARLLSFLAARAIPGVESTAAGTYRRALQTSAGTAVATLRADTSLHVELEFADLSVFQPAVTKIRRLVDLDADSLAVDAALSEDPVLAGMVRRRPGLRVPGTVDGFEILVRAVVGQQVSVAGARTLLGRIVENASPASNLPHDLKLFPAANALATADLTGLGLTNRRIDTLRAAAELVAAGQLDLRPGVDRMRARQQLLAIPGVGPWTAEYVAMRALADPDAFPATDLVVQRRVESMGLDSGRWRPWRAYAAVHIWTDYAEENQ
jgi:AraC family transcriptional regulator of adaptative response / DNA-3-methyladenine glycosylase II